MAETPATNPLLYTDASGEPLSDLQQPGEPNRGFRLPERFERPGYQELNDAERHVFHPIHEVFPAGAGVPHEPGVSEVVAAALVSNPNKELTYNREVMEQYYQYPETFPFIECDATITITEDQANQIAEALNIPMDPGEYTEESRTWDVEDLYSRGHYISDSPEAHIKRVVVDVLRGGHPGDYDYESRPIEQVLEAAKRPVFEAAVAERSEECIDLCRNTLLEGFKAEDLAALQSVSELYVLHDGKFPIYIANFSERKMTREQLSQMVNAVRAASDQTSGRLSEAVRVLAILPADHPQFSRSHADEETGTVTAGIKLLGDTVAISDLFIEPPEEPAENTGQPYITADFLADGHRRHGLELTTYHELMHPLTLALHHQFAAMVGEEEPHTDYGQEEGSKEDVVETLSSLHAGGAAAQAVGPEHVRAALNILNQIKGPQPLQGPRYVDCVEIPLDGPERFCPDVDKVQILVRNITVQIGKSPQL